MPPDHEPSAGLLAVGGPVAGADARALCDRLRSLIAASDAGVIVCDVGSLPADARAIEALARLQLTARRAQRHIRLRRASPELEQLLDFVGLADVLPGGGAG